MDHILITKKQAREFLLKKQLLYHPQSLSGMEGIEKVFQHLRLIQYDPLKPCGRNTDLVLQARVKNIHPDDYYHWLYDQKKGIECYDKDLSIVPIEDFAFSHHVRQNAREHPYIMEFVKTYNHELEALLQRIHTNGPISSRDIGDTRRTDYGWMGTELWGRTALDILWKTGRVVITERRNGRKYYGIQAESKDAPFEIEEEHIIRRIQSIGLMRANGSGPAWDRIGYWKTIRAIIDDLLEKGICTKVAIEGVKMTYLMCASDEKLLHHAPLSSKRMVYIAPLDNLMWDRDLLVDIFDFFYRWEVYTPLAKRQYGYYVLPILYKDALVGRIEPVLRKDKVLEIKGFWQEHATNWTEEMWEAFRKSLLEFKKYVQAQDIYIKPGIFPKKFAL